MGAESENSALAVTCNTPAHWLESIAMNFGETLVENNQLAIQDDYTSLPGLSLYAKGGGDAVLAILLEWNESGVSLGCFFDKPFASRQAWVVDP